MDKLKMHSPDMTQQNIAKIQALFPNCVTESIGVDGELKLAIDFDQLKQELSDSLLEGDRERYHLNWPGKRQSIVLANSPITKTLRPDLSKSVDFDSTSNIFIEGDNLEAIKLLQDSYLGKVKMIFIDPPYNTGKDFIYSDKFNKSSEEYFRESMQVDEFENKMVSNTETNGRFHSDWLSMMYPRLKLSRNFLTEDGVIVVHIDENEYPNLEKILSEIFGEENNLGTIVWDKRNPKGDATGVAQQHELISIYCKNRDYFKENVEFKRPKENASKIIDKASELIQRNSGVVDDKIRTEFKKWISKSPFSGGEKAYSFIDDEGRVYRTVSMAWPNKKKAPDDYFIPLVHPETKKECPVPERGWRNPPATMKKLLDAGLIVFGKDEATQPTRKYLLSENMYENVPSLLYFAGSDDSLLSSMGIPFDTPKSVEVTKRVIESVCNGDDIVMDFFAGSGTTGHAVFDLNKKQGNNLRFILVQVDEKCDESIVKNYKFKSISDLSIKRLVEAGKLFENFLDDKGFRFFKVDTSNMADVYYAPDQVTQGSLDLLVDNIKADRTDEDLLFQVLLDWGVDLSLPIKKESIQGKSVFFVDDDALVACFDLRINEALIKELAAKEPLRVVFRDDGFESDAVKINAEQIFKQVSPHTEVKAI
ncbi:site-specific DNA-methyltransferase [Providencia rettgeri]